MEMKDLIRQLLRECTFADTSVDRNIDDRIFRMMGALGAKGNDLEKNLEFFFTVPAWKIYSFLLFLISFRFLSSILFLNLFGYPLEHKTMQILFFLCKIIFFFERLFLQDASSISKKSLFKFGRLIEESRVNIEMPTDWRIKK